MIKLSSDDVSLGLRLDYKSVKAAKALTHTWEKNWFSGQRLQTLASCSGNTCQ